jgi:hypothetical protein
VIFQYIYLGFAKAYIKKTKESYRANSWKKWYWCNTFITIVLVGMLITGMFSFYFGLFAMIVIKWPDYSLLFMTYTNSFVGASDADVKNQSYVYQDLVRLNLIVPVLVGVLVVVGGVGNYMVFSQSEDNPEEEATPLSTKKVYPSSDVSLKDEEMR